ncbi:hypothetical protein SODALDRAFT_362448 [Sodiomyces alkalinus F11]|uniref:Uncharacterized protein n=1 Tax=Sodiomyces alkalinus (strain CBS 110278 / VKM F-3762 / F11) TaxID=1314773 RepID=A0A3N2PQ41_SODAK|nr:hypothetical protein SODALDRAFT_362448 [Sodiomyces alkalinus F11]ROT36627.1 hypothetical protein SODALDRAFT_362448 [Sodiomyces alkalinus F11]
MLHGTFAEDIPTNIDDKYDETPKMHLQMIPSLDFWTPLRRCSLMDAGSRFPETRQSASEKYQTLILVVWESDCGTIEHRKQRKRDTAALTSSGGYLGRLDSNFVLSPRLEKESVGIRSLPSPDSIPFSFQSGGFSKVKEGSQGMTMEVHVTPRRHCMRDGRTRRLEASSFLLLSASSLEQKKAPGIWLGDGVGRSD